MFLPKHKLVFTLASSTKCISPRTSFPANTLTQVHNKHGHSGAYRSSQNPLPNIPRAPWPGGAIFCPSESICANTTASGASAFRPLAAGGFSARWRRLRHFLSTPLCRQPAKTSEYRRILLHQALVWKHCFLRLKA